MLTFHLICYVTCAFNVYIFLGDLSLCRPQSSKYNQVQSWVEEQRHKNEVGIKRNPCSGNNDYP